MKILTTIEVSLTLLVMASFVAIARIAAWLMKMEISDPTRAHLLMARLDPVANVLCDIIWFSWLIFTPFYLLILFIQLGARLFCRLTGENSKIGAKLKDHSPK
jgi:hypothetical protein